MDTLDGYAFCQELVWQYGVRKAQQIGGETQNKKTPGFESLLICNNNLADLVSRNWNTIYTSLYGMYRRLSDLKTADSQ
jgi:hypothetical protein